MPERLSPEERQQIVDLYGQGLKWVEIEAATGRSRQSIGRVLAENGVKVNRNNAGRRVNANRIAELYGQGVELAAIVEMVGCSITSVTRVIAERGLRRNRPWLTDEETAEIAAAYQAGEGGIDLAHRLGLDPQIVYRALRRAGVKAREHPGLTHPHYFDRVDTEEKAYWLGFISADGYVFGSRFPNALEVRLARVDHDHLEKLRLALGVERPVKDADFFSLGKSRPMSTLSVYSTRLVNALIALGVTPNKSLTLQPWDGPPELMRHYWRGLIDGDGCLTRHSQNARAWEVQLVGSEYACAGFAAWATALIGRPYKGVPRKDSKAWVARVSGVQNARLLVAELYAGSTVSLDRKRELARRVLAGGDPEFDKQGGTDDHPD